MEAPETGGPPPFELLERLGAGGMGVVWKARDTASGETVALKVLHSHLADDPDYVSRLEREVELARRIDSPNVVSVLGYGRRENVPFMVMEYIDGRSLRDVLQERTRLPWNGKDGCKEILLQVGRALTAAHAAGIVHRDVKPSNILLTADGTAKLADFGISRALDLTRLTGSATTLGTPAYMSPDLDVTAKSDLYALGCVAYEMLSGRQPFGRESQQQVMMQHLREAPDLGRIPRVARRVVGQLMSKKPDERTESAAALVALLESGKGELRGPGLPPAWAILGAPFALAAGAAIVFGAKSQWFESQPTTETASVLVANNVVPPTQTPTPNATPVPDTATPAPTLSFAITGLTRTATPTPGSGTLAATATARPPTPTPTRTPTPKPAAPALTPAPWNLLAPNTMTIASMTRGTGNNYTVTVYYNYAGARTDVSVFADTADGCTDTFGHMVDVYFPGYASKSNPLPAGKAGQMSFSVRPSMVRSTYAVTCKSVTFRTTASEVSGASWSAAPIAFSPQ